MMKTQLETVVKLYRQYASSIPFPKGGIIKTLNDGRVLLQTFWRVRDIEKLEHTSFVKEFVSQPNGKLDFTQTGFPTDVNAESLTCVSTSGQKRAVLRKFTDAKGIKKQILELWTKESKIQSIDLKGLDVHGEICDDDTFGCLEWSADETKLLYVAEPKAPKDESFFTTKPEKADNGEKHSSPSTEPGIGHYREEWGEQLVGRQHPFPCILDLETEKIRVVPVGNYSCGQAIWGPRDKSVIFVAWKEEPRRLGLIFCPIRTNKLCSYHLVEDKLSSLFEVEDYCMHSPRLSPDHKCLVFLNNPVGGPHRRCSRLSMYDFESCEHSVIVDIVENPTDGGFPGIYATTLPRKCWFNNKTVLIQSPWRSREELISINISNGEVRKITNDEEFGAWTLMDILDGLILASRSSFNVKSHLVLGQTAGDLTEVKWFNVEPANKHKLDGIEMLTLSSELPDAKGQQFEALISKPTDLEGTIPVIFILHGGPHGLMTPQFYLIQFLFNQLGFAVVMVNFRGSLGFGQNSLESLLTSAGKQDVEEVVQITQKILKMGWADEKRLALYGGSYGGYLTAQLVGQHPELYCACVCRNPVVDLNATVDTSDIPDWSWVTAGLGSLYNSTVLPDPEVRKVFWEKSPARYLPNVKANFLMLLSKNDLRVPPFQGLTYYHQLKALGKAKTKMYMYDDNHGQAKIDVECDAFVRSTLWLMDAFHPPEGPQESL